MTPLSVCFRRHCLVLLACALAFCCEARTLTAKDNVVDLSIIERSDELRPLMSRQQRIAMLEAGKMIQSGESDIKTGSYLTQRKPSALKPNEDMKPSIERGKNLIEKGQSKIVQGQRMMVEVLTAVEKHAAAKQAIASKKFNFITTRADYTPALQAAAETILKDCWDADYNHIFFDGLQIVRGDRASKASADLHNAAYDTFIKTDGTRFSVSVPLGLELTQSNDSTDYAFEYDNSAAFKDEKIALLAIEIIAPGNAANAILWVRALDWDTQQIIASSLTYLSDSGELLPQVQESPEPVQPSIVEEVLINDANMLIDGLAAIESPYRFEVTTTQIDANALILQALLSDSILKNSNLTLVDNIYIGRTYLDDDDDSAGLKRTATATIEISPVDNTLNTYMVTTQAHGSERVLEIGTMTLKFSAKVAELTN